MLLCNYDLHSNTVNYLILHHHFAAWKSCDSNTNKGGELFVEVVCCIGLQV